MKKKKIVFLSNKNKIVFLTFFFSIWKSKTCFLICFFLFSTKTEKLFSCLNIKTHTLCSYHIFFVISVLCLFFVDAACPSRWRGVPLPQPRRCRGEDSGPRGPLRRGKVDDDQASPPILRPDIGLGYAGWGRLEDPQRGVVQATGKVIVGGAGGDVAAVVVVVVVVVVAVVGVAVAVGLWSIAINVNNRQQWASNVNSAVP